MESIKCLHPVIIFNPLALDFIHIGLCRLLYRGVFSKDRLCDKNHRFRSGNFHPKNTHVTSTTLDDYQIVTPDNKIIPLYLAVPCNHCALCRSRKREDWSTRAEAEAAMSTTIPVFFTLTYDNKHIEYNHQTKIVNKHHVNYKQPSLRKEHVQKFMNLLRKYLVRKLNYTTKLRYIIVGEYGTHTHRPHYHAVLFNFPGPKDLGIDLTLPSLTQDINYIKASEELLHKCWQYSAPNKSFDFDYVGVTKTIKNGLRWRNVSKKGNSKGCAKYVAKYINKKGSVPPYADKMQAMCSNRGGGIGVPYLKSQLSFYRHPENSQFIHIKNIFTNQETKAIMPQLFKTHLFPSRSKNYSKRLREKECLAISIINTINYITHAYGMTESYIHNYPMIQSLKPSLSVKEKEQSLPLFEITPGNILQPHKLVYQIKHHTISTIHVFKAIAKYMSTVESIEQELTARYGFKLLSYDHARQAKTQYADYIEEHIVHRLFDVETLNTTQESFDNLSKYKETF